MSKKKTEIKDDDIIELSLLLIDYNTLTDLYDKVPSISDFWYELTDVESRLVDYMDNLSFSKATIGAILEEWGGPYWYKYDKQDEEDDDIVDLFDLDKTEKRIQDYYKESISEDACKIFNEAKTKEENKMECMCDIIKRINEIEAYVDDTNHLQNLIDTDQRLHSNLPDGHIVLFDKDEIKAIIEIRKRKFDDLLEELKDAIEGVMDKE